MRLEFSLLCALVAVLFFSACPDCSYSQSPDLLEAKVDMLTQSVIVTIESDHEALKSRVLGLGPGLVPIVTRKLLDSLLEKALPEAVKDTLLMHLPPDDEKRMRYQSALLQLQEIALENMALKPQVRSDARDSIYQALQSPYEHTRLFALQAAAYGVGSEAVDHIVPLLDDLEKQNRVIAAKMLSKIGDADTAAKIEKVLEKRRQGLTPEQIEADWSFRHAEKAIKELKTKNAAMPRKPVPATAEPIIPSPIAQRDASTPQSSAAVAGVGNSGVSSPLPGGFVFGTSIAITLIAGVSWVLLRLRRKKG